MKVMLRFCCFLLLAAGWSLAQSNEVSFSVGGLRSSDQRSTTSLAITCPTTDPTCNVLGLLVPGAAKFSLQGMYARRLRALGPVTVFAEMPLMVVPSHMEQTRVVSPAQLLAVGAQGSTFHSSSLFFTPSVRLKFLGSAPVSPFVSVGGGLAHFSATDDSSGVADTTRNTGALQFGGGLDLRVPLSALALRMEARDFWSGLRQNPPALTQQSPSHLHNLYFGGGAVVRF